MNLPDESLTEAAEGSAGAGAGAWGFNSRLASERNSLNKSPCSTRAAERRRCGEFRPSLHWKGLLFIARES